MFRRHRWTQEERDIVRRNYRHTQASRRELAYRLSEVAGERITEFAVAGQVSIMGLAKRDDRHRWTPDEEERLVDLIARYNPRRIAIMMHRSINSVVVKAQRLHASRRVRDGWFTKAEVAEILGTDHKWVQRRIDNGAIIASYHHDRKPSQNGSGSWHIEASALKSYIRRYPDELTSRNVNLPLIVELLVGIKNGNGLHKGENS